MKRDRLMLRSAARMRAFAKVASSSVTVTFFMRRGRGSASLTIITRTPCNLAWVVHLRTMNRRLLALFLIVASTAGAALAQPYPSKPIRFIVGFPPGGSADPTTRILGSALAEQLGVPVVVENRPGADSAIATEQVTRLPADGYNIMFASNSGVVAPIALRKEAPYDPLTQLTHIS